LRARKRASAPIGDNLQLRVTRSERKSGRNSATGSHRMVEETLLRSCLSQGVVSIEMRWFPAAESLGIEHCAMGRIVIAHPVKGLSEALLQSEVEIGPSDEHAVVEWGRRPDLGQRALRYQTLAPQRPPERAADCAGICSAVENRTNHLG